MKKLFVQDHKLVEVGALLIHHAADQTGEETKPVDHACELIDIDANQLHGLVKYSDAPFEGEEQWVPGTLLAEQPAAQPAEETPVRDAMREAGAEAIKDEVAAPTEEPPKEEESAPAEEQPATNPS